MLNASDANFSEVLAAPQAAVYFWSPTCGYCKAFTPIFEALEATYGGRVLMVKANVQDAPKAAASYGLTGVPTVVFLRNGQVVGQEVTGGMTQPEFVALMNAAFSGGAAVPAGVDAGAASHADEGSLWPLVLLAGLGVGAYYALDLKKYF